MRAAEAIAEQLHGEVRTIDFMAREISLPNWLMKKFYLLALKFIPDLYDRIYKFTGARQIGALTRFLISTLMYFPFKKLLSDYRPDVVVCTHPFPEAAAALWKFLHAKSARSFLLTTVLTDYSLHEIWIYGEVDIYFVATESMREELSTHSRPNQEIYATGIPINRNFGNVKAVRAVVPTILVMGGGLGLGSIEETLTELNAVELPLKIVVVVGQNEALLTRLKNLPMRHEVELLGFVENVHELMAAADLLITKPGGLTIAEAFAVGLPMLLHAPIPGPEARNAEYAILNGSAMSVGAKKVSSIVTELLANPRRLDEMKLQARSLGKLSAAINISELLMCSNIAGR